MQHILCNILDEHNCKIIPLRWHAKRFHCISLDGWEKITLDVNDKSFFEVEHIILAVTKAFIELFNETHAFTEPQLIFKFDVEIIIKFGIMELEEFEKWHKSE